MILHHEGIILQQGYEALEAITLKEQTAKRVVFSTLAGDLEVSGYAEGVLRMKLAANHSQPDYGILFAEPEDRPLQVTVIEHGYRIVSGNAALEISSGPMRIRFYKDGKLLLQSVTDRTIEGHLRFSPFAKRADSWLVALALGNGEPVYGLGEKWAALNRRGQLIHNWNEDATTLNSELSYKNTPFAWSPEGWGLFTHTPSKVTHGVGYPQWSHRSYVLQFLMRNWICFSLLRTIRRGCWNVTPT